MGFLPNICISTEYEGSEEVLKITSFPFTKLESKVKFCELDKIILDYYTASINPITDAIGIIDTFNGLLKLNVLLRVYFRVEFTF